MKNLLFIFMFIFSIFSIFIHNNYSLTQNTNISSQLAIPIYNVNFEESKVLDNSNTSINYSFKINNFNNEFISDVPFSFNFYIENLSADFSCKCFMNNKEITFNNLKSNSFILNNTTKEEYLINIYIGYIGNFSTTINSNIKIKLFYNFNNSLYSKEFDFLKINISEISNIDSNKSTNSRNSKNLKKHSKNASLKGFSNSKQPSSNINSDIYIDTNTNLQIKISK